MHLVTSQPELSLIGLFGINAKEPITYVVMNCLSSITVIVMVYSQHRLIQPLLVRSTSLIRPFPLDTHSGHTESVAPLNSTANFAYSLVELSAVDCMYGQCSSHLAKNCVCAPVVRPG